MFLNYLYHFLNFTQDYLAILIIYFCLFRNEYEFNIFFNYSKTKKKVDYHY